LFQLFQRKPNQPLANRIANLFFKSLRYLFHRSSPITGLPDECGCSIQTISLVAVQIIDEQFVGQALNH
jgi:hypothetical protein